MDEVIDVGNITSSGVFYNTSERVARDKSCFRGIIENELKRLKIYEREILIVSLVLIKGYSFDRLDVELADNNEIEGIYTFVENALEELTKVSDRLTMLQNTPATSINREPKY